MYEITVTRVFCAAHALRLPDGSIEPLHGHNWEVRVTVAAAQLDAMETVMDFHDLESALDRLVGPANNANLNDLPPFVGADGALAVNPSAERVAQWIGDEMAGALPATVKLHHVRVSEAPGCAATYRP